ncbi:virulence factor TspB C-terminal domain-related protein [Acinetobacter johnsonii]|uniref:virulence factor TspB C-terminal domain-related protein n=1 Tax=Acinetobacter johnsonii TaxID=40214 RepID=UPI00244766B1|nr:virulence factor TspB C-terminal domain-related protein [Acinetobacter johnsonii]MDH1279040.1 virulence factor TspB C-terminal domain-related protein [Acinetobacter johnsonii]
MVNRIRFLFCTLACFFSITSYASDLPANPRNDTPAQSLKRLQDNFKSQANYDAGIKRNLAELDAKIYMNEGTKRASVEQMLVRSGVVESGAKAEIVAKVTQPADTGKAAKTLADRLGKAKDYAKHAGKASIPAFLGGAAVQALVDGVGWVMDEGGKVTKKDEGSVICADNSCASFEYVWFLNYKSEYHSVPSLSACTKALGNENWWGKTLFKYTSADKGICYGSDTDRVLSEFNKVKNPNYSPSAPQPENVEVTQEQLTEALKNALESNNPALATAIAEALKAAYLFDGSEGQDASSNTIAIGTANDMNEVVDRAFDNPTPNATSDKPSGYYKITDGEKTVEGYVTTPDTTGKTETETKTETTTDPVTGNQTTTGTSTGSLQLPAFCSWAAIVCDWINWTKEEPNEPEQPKPVFEEINVPLTPFSIAKFNAQCPPDENLSLNLMGQEMSFVFPMKPFCDFFSGIKPFVIALASFWAVKLIGNASFNSGN